MTTSALTILALLVGANAAVQDAGPIAKVVVMLKDLKTGLDNDQTAEQAAYDKFACWCEETTQRKAASIDAAKATMAAMGQMILKQKGLVSIRTAEMAKSNRQIAQNEAATADATGIRAKENAAWQAESAETSSAQAALDMAMKVLTKATKGAFIQADATEQIQATMSAVIDTAPVEVLDKLSADKLQSLRSFAQVRGKAGYAPQSATIQGILADMYVTMGVSLQDNTATEASKNRNFENLVAGQDKALAALQRKLARETKEKVEAAEMLAEATQAYDQASKQLDADVKFFDITAASCTEKSNEWKIRSDLRKEETEGISGAIKILDSDDAKATFGAAISGDSVGTKKRFVSKGLFFLQVESDKTVNMDKLYMKLKEQATKSHSLRLAALAAEVRMSKSGHFDVVIKAVDDLVVVLKSEQQDDLKKRDLCEKDYQIYDKEKAEEDHEIKNNNAKTTDLSNKITALGAAKSQIILDIASTEADLALMKRDREGENALFIAEKQLDVDTVALLKRAKETMIAFYEKHKTGMGPVQLAEFPSDDKTIELAAAAQAPAKAEAVKAPEAKIDRLVEYKTKGAAKEVTNADIKKHLQSLDKNQDGKLTTAEVTKGKVSLLQVESKASPLEDQDVAPDATLSGKGARNNQSKGIVSILTQLTEDLEQGIKDSIRSEGESQISYEKAKAAAEQLLADQNAEKVRLTTAIAAREQDKTDEEKSKTDNTAELTSAQKVHDDMKTDCDYMIANYNKRAEFRAAEQESMLDAKEFLQGAQADSLLQKGKPEKTHAGIMFSHLSSPGLN